MRLADVRLMSDYNYWANARIMDAARRVPAEQFTTAQLGYCNLRDALVHTLFAEYIWLLRWKGIPPETVKFPDEFPTLDSVRARWREEEQSMYAFLDSLSETELERVVTYKRRTGELDSRPLWQYMVHVVNHGTQHRAEIAMLLTEFGASPGDVDFTVFLREPHQR
jgi:uncharacterized damage-inducible protein DinB